MLLHSALEHLVLLGHIHYFLGHLAVDGGAREGSQRVLLLDYTLLRSIIPCLLCFLLILHLLDLFYCLFNSFILHLSYSRLLRSSRVACFRQHLWSLRTKVALNCFSHLRLSRFNGFKVEFPWFVILTLESMIWVSWGSNLAASHPHLRDSGHLFSNDHFLGLINSLFFVLHEILLVFDNSVVCSIPIMWHLRFIRVKHFFFQLWDGFLQGLSNWLFFRALRALGAMLSCRTFGSWWFSSCYTFRTYRFRFWTLRFYRFRMFNIKISTLGGENIVNFCVTWWLFTMVFNELSFITAFILSFGQLYFSCRLSLVPLRSNLSC